MKNTPNLTLIETTILAFNEAKARFTVGIEERASDPAIYFIFDTETNIRVAEKSTQKEMAFRISLWGTPNKPQRNPIQNINGQALDRWNQP